LLEPTPLQHLTETYEMGPGLDDRKLNGTPTEPRSNGVGKQPQIRTLKNAKKKDRRLEALSLIEEKLPQDGIFEGCPLPGPWS